MKKVIYFDMDGTIADFYNQKDWLLKLQEEDVSPYTNAGLLPDKEQFLEMLTTLKGLGYIIGVISWLGKRSTEDFKARVRQAKLDWIAQHLGDIFDEIHLLQYGTPKHHVALDNLPCYLVDDNPLVLKLWSKVGGCAIHADNIMNLLQIVTD